MPYLGDYLGHLLSELAIARMQSDVETVRIAELYAAHPLLRTMPVPHVRLSDVDLEVPVLIEDVEAPRAGESPRGGPSVPEVRKVFDRVLTSHLAELGVAMTPAARRTLASALHQRIALQTGPTETAVDVHRLADGLSEIATRAIAALRPKAAATPDDGRALKAAARIAFLELRKPPPRLKVLVTSSELRERGTPENVTKVRLRVTEQGVEWTTVEVGGATRDQLVPE
jgi:hypothetical protein